MAVSVKFYVRRKLGCERICSIVNSAMDNRQPLDNTGAAANTHVGSELPQPRKQHRLLEVISTVLIVLLAVSLPFIFAAYAFQSYTVEGESMEPTLHNNDRLIVWKVPRTWARITGHQYVPKRGDIIILNEKGLSSYGDTSDSKQLVKRVIGLPGDHIVIKDDAITIYNAEHPKGFQPDKTLPYGQHTNIPPTTNDLDITLSSTQLFVCGDNRGNSLDSRTFGPIETNQVVGKLVARILPLGDMKAF